MDARTLARRVLSVAMRSGMRRAFEAFFFIFVSVVGWGGAWARDCESDSIRGVSQSGEIIIMLSGHVYEVMAGDTVDSMLWLTADEVLVCEAPLKYKGKVYLLYEIINTDESGEKVSARMLR